MNRKFIAVPSIALAGALIAVAQNPTKVGIIHIQRAIIETKEGQVAAKELEAKSAPVRKDLVKKQDDIQSMENQLRTQSNTASDEVKKRLMRDIDQKTKIFNRDMQDAQSEFDQEQQKVLQELGGKMMAVIDKYAKDNGFAVILDVSAQNTPVLYASPAINVTEEIIKLYDAAIPSAPASGGASAAPPTAPSAKPTTPVAAPPATKKK